MPVINVPIRVENAARAKSELNQLARILGQAATTAGTAESKIASLGSTTKTVANASVTNILRLKNEILALAGAYASLAAVQKHVGNIFGDSSVVEDARISVASVLNMTQELRDENGEILKGQDAYNASLRLSSDIIAKIQVLALGTNVTFQELVSTVSAIIAPATKVGIAVERIPDLAVKVTNAMRALNIPVEQLRTEFEALVSGNINRAQDLLVGYLGLTGNMIRDFQKAGTLEAELNKRLETFSFAAAETATSWTGIKNALADSIQMLNRWTGSGLFEGSKNSVAALSKFLIRIENGTPRVGEGFENIAAAITRLQDAIGDRLITATADLLEMLAALNQPGNLAVLEGTLEDIAGAAGEAWNILKQAAGLVSGIGSSVLSAWRELPDPIREYGLILAMLGGKRGLAAFSLATEGIQMVATQVKAWGAVLRGELALADFAKMNGEEARAWLNQNKDTGVAPAMASSHGAPQLARSTDSVGTPPKVTATGKIGTYASDRGNDATLKRTEKAAQKLADLWYQVKQMEDAATSDNTLEKKLQEIAQAGKAAGATAPDIARLQNAYAAAFKKDVLADFHKEILSLQGDTQGLTQLETQAQVDSWTSKLKGLGLTAGEVSDKIAVLRRALEKKSEVKDLQTAADFYRELGDLSGSYGQSIEYQNRLIEQQAQLYRTSGIPEALVQQWEALKKLETARDPWSGFTRTTNKYFADATNWAQQFGNAWNGVMDGMTDSFMTFCKTGKLDFNDMIDSFISDLMRLTFQAASSGLFKGLTGLVGGLFGSGSMGSLVDTASNAMQAIPGIAHSGWHVGHEAPADGFRSVPAMAFAGAPRLHSGGGWFRSDEYPAILQRGERVLNRDETAAYHAGMQAGGYGAAISVPVNVVIENKTGENITAQKMGQKANAKGSLDVTILMTRTVVNDVAQGNGGPIAKTMESIYGLKRLSRGR